MVLFLKRSPLAANHLSSRRISCFVKAELPNSFRIASTATSFPLFASACTTAIGVTINIVNISIKTWRIVLMNLVPACLCL